MFAPSHPAAATATASSRTILVVGDSLSAAYGIAVEDGWVSLLATALREGAAGSDSKRYRVVNASISGETTGGALARLPGLLTEYQPTVVVIELGGNDGLQGHPVAGIRHNLAQLVQLSQQAGARVLLLGIHIPPNYGSRYTQQFYASYELTAQKFDIPLVPFLLERVATHPELMQADGIHPRAAAQPTMLDNVLPTLQKLL